MEYAVRQQLDLRKQDQRKFNWVNNSGSTELDLDIKKSIDDAIDYVLDSSV